MTHRELRAMIRHLSGCQVDRLGQMASRFLTLKQELAEIEPACRPVCGDEKADFFARVSKMASSNFSASPADTSSRMT